VPIVIGSSWHLLLVGSPVVLGELSDPTGSRSAKVARFMLRLPH
jgi:hypothetical protein